MLFIILIMLTGSCHWSSSRLEVDLSDIPFEPVRIHRYDQALFAIPHDRLVEGLEQIRPSYLFFLDTDLHDSTKISNLEEYLTNVRTIEFQETSQAQYPGLSVLEEELAGAFHHLRYYYPDARIPRMYTYISGGEYQYPVRFVDSVLLIALDVYLGSGFKPYAADGIPLYKMQRMESGFILPDCIRVLADSYYPVTYPGNTLLDQMVDAGKRIYFVDALIPDYPDRFKIGYTDQQMHWIEANEAQVWAAIIENQLLYSSVGSIVRTFLADGPFTADFSAESPPRLGEYLGWQIVRGYMERHPGVTLDELIHETDTQKILTGSKYKPRK